MNKIILITLTILCISCDRKPGAGQSISKDKGVADIGAPQYVCEFSDGRKLHRFQVGSVSVESPHWVYIVSPSNEITINKREQMGKTTVNKVVVELPE